MHAVHQYLRGKMIDWYVLYYYNVFKYANFYFCKFSLRKKLHNLNFWWQKNNSWLCGNRVKSCVIEWVKRNKLRFFGNVDRRKSEEFMKKVYVSETDDPGRRGRPVVRWKDRVKEYMHWRPESISSRTLFYRPSPPLPNTLLGLRRPSHCLTCLPTRTLGLCHLLLCVLEGIYWDFLECYT